MSKIKMLNCSNCKQKKIQMSLVGVDMFFLVKLYKCSFCWQLKKLKITENELQNDSFKEFKRNDEFIKKFDKIKNNTI